MVSGFKIESSGMYTIDLFNGESIQGVINIEAGDAIITVVEEAISSAKGEIYTVWALHEKALSRVVEKEFGNIYSL